MRQILMISVYIPQTGIPGCTLMLSSPMSPRTCLPLTGARTLMLQFSSLPMLHASIFRVNDSHV